MEEKSYVAGQLPGLHGVHGLFIDAFIVALHVAGVLFFVLVLSGQKTQKLKNFQLFFSLIYFIQISTYGTWLSVTMATHITGELGDFGCILKLRRLAEVDAVTFRVIQVLPVLHL